MSKIKFLIRKLPACLALLLFISAPVGAATLSVLKVDLRRAYDAWDMNRQAANYVEVVEVR